MVSLNRRGLVIGLCMIALLVAPAAAATWAGENHNTFFLISNSTTAPTTYYNWDNAPEIVDSTASTITINAGMGTVLWKSYITKPGEPGVTTILPNMWRYRLYLGADSAVGETQIQAVLYNRSLDGTETRVFYNAMASADINGLGPTEYLISYARRNVTTLFPGDRLVMKFYVKTSKVSNTIVTMWNGGTNTSSMVSAGTFYVPELDPDFPEDIDAIAGSGAMTSGLIAGGIGGTVALMLYARRKRQ